MIEKGRRNEKEKVVFVTYEKELGLHTVEGVWILGNWWALRQFQLVNGKFTQSGCNWYSKEEIANILKQEGKITNSGYARVEETAAGILLIREDEEGLERVV